LKHIEATTFIAIFCAKPILRGEVRLFIKEEKSSFKKCSFLVTPNTSFSMQSLLKPAVLKRSIWTPQAPWEVCSLRRRRQFKRRDCSAGAVLLASLYAAFLGFFDMRQNDFRGQTCRAEDLGRAEGLNPLELKGYKAAEALAT